MANHSMPTARMHNAGNSTARQLGGEGAAATRYSNEPPTTAVAATQTAKLGDRSTATAARTATASASDIKDSLARGTTVSPGILSTQASGATPFINMIAITTEMAKGTTTHGRRRHPKVAAKASHAAVPPT
jgi:hypothetical protein